MMSAKKYRLPNFTVVIMVGIAEYRPEIRGL